VLLQLYSGLFLIFGLSLLSFVKGKNIAQKLLTPLGLFTLYHSFIFYLMPFLEVHFQVGRFPQYYRDQEIEIFYALFIALIYQMLVTLTVVNGKKTSFSYGALVQASKNLTLKTKLAKVLCWFFVLIGCFVMTRLALQYIGNFAYFMFNRINLLSGYGYFTKMLAYSVPLGVMLLCKKPDSSRLLSYVNLFILLLAIFVVSLLIGSRAQALFLIPYLFATWVFISGKQINTKKIVKIGGYIFLLFAFSAVLSEVRNDIKNDKMDSYTSQSGPAIEYGKSIVEELRNSFAHAELFAFSLAHGERFEFSAGYTYFAGIVSFVPRVLWAEKPVGGGPMLANIVRPGAYKLGEQEGNSSLTTGMIIESYLNFSLIGVVFVALIHGMMLSKITYFAEQVKDPLDIALFLVTTNFLAMTLVNAEFLGAFSAYLFVILPIYLIKKVKI